MELTTEQFIFTILRPRSKSRSRLLLPMLYQKSCSGFKENNASVLPPLWLDRKHAFAEERRQDCFLPPLSSLPGRMLETNLLNLGILDTVKDAFTNRAWTLMLQRIRTRYGFG